ncbi:MAG: hypothetical protein U0231_09480 [Nitrospiraceae bacterium]
MNMTLDELIGPIQGLLGVQGLIGDQRVTIADVTDDSRKVKPGALFVAVKGSGLTATIFWTPLREATAGGSRRPTAGVRSDRFPS